MAKKLDKLVEKGDNEYRDLYEKLREELFHYRVEIQSYKRSMRMLWTCVSVVVAVIGFFGYNRVEILLEKVEFNANNRLAKTDSLLSKVDTRFLDSLRAVVDERTASYEEAIAALEKGARVNNELYRKLISGLPYNKRKEIHMGPYVVEKAFNLFDIVYYNDKYSIGKDGDCYVVMGDEYAKDKDDVWLISVSPKDRNIMVFCQTFEVQNNYNKLFYAFEKFEKYFDYTLHVTLLRKRGKDIVGYQISKSIALK